MNRWMVSNISSGWPICRRSKTKCWATTAMVPLEFLSARRSRTAICCAASVMLFHPRYFAFQVVESSLFLADCKIIYIICIYCNTHTYWGSRGLHFQTMPYTWLCLRTENRSRKTHVFEYRDCGVGWGGGACSLYFVHDILPCCWDLWDRLLRYMLLRCWDLWDRLLRYMFYVKSDEKVNSQQLECQKWPLDGVR